MMNEFFHLFTIHYMLQNVTHVLTMHPLPYPPNKLIIIVIKSMQMQVEIFLIVPSYYFVVFECILQWRNLFGWQNNCLHSKTNLPPILMLNGKLECPKSPNWPKNCIQWLIHKDNTLTTKKIPRRTFLSFTKNKINFFQHCYFILSESCPLLHNQHYKHKGPVNCT